MFSNIPSSEALQSALILKPASKKYVCGEPLVSVVTVCFNPLRDGRKFLFEKNLNSVQQQRGIMLEHIIVDGSSDDGTLNFLLEYNNELYDIRILSMVDSGIYEAMNRGIALARGKYVIFLNSDDFYHRSDGLSVSARILEESNFSFTFAPVCPKGFFTLFTHYGHPQRRLHKIFVANVTPHPSMLYCRNALMEIGGYDQTYRLAADYDMTLRLIIAGFKGIFVNHCFATFVLGGFSTQNKNKKLEVREKIRMVRNAHRQAFGIELSEKESESLVIKGKYPRKYLSVYVKSQQLVAETFQAIPQGLFDKLLRRFNYEKYYLMCLLSS